MFPDRHVGPEQVDTGAHGVARVDQQRVHPGEVLSGPAPIGDGDRGPRQAEMSLGVALGAGASRLEARQQALADLDDAADVSGEDGRVEEQLMATDHLVRVTALGDHPLGGGNGSRDRAGSEGGLGGRNEQVGRPLPVAGGLGELGRELQPLRTGAGAGVESGERPFGDGHPLG